MLSLGSQPSQSTAALSGGSGDAPLLPPPELSPKLAAPVSENPMLSGSALSGEAEAPPPLPVRSTVAVGDLHHERSFHHHHQPHGGHQHYQQPHAQAGSAHVAHGARGAHHSGFQQQFSRHPSMRGNGASHGAAHDSSGSNQQHHPAAAAHSAPGSRHNDSEEFGHCSDGAVAPACMQSITAVSGVFTPAGVFGHGISWPGTAAGAASVAASCWASPEFGIGTRSPTRFGVSVDTPTTLCAEPSPGLHAANSPLEHSLIDSRMTQMGRGAFGTVYVSNAAAAGISTGALSSGSSAANSGSAGSFSGQPFARKVIPLTTEKVGQKNLRAELEVARRLQARAPDHHALRVFGASVRPSVAIIDMEFLDGGPVTRLGALNEDPQLLAEVMRSLVLGLKILHFEIGMLHRDLKPANILFSRLRGEIKIVDFGVAVVIDPSEITEIFNTNIATDQQGSILQMSPERLRGEAHGFASDVWALGVTIAEIAGGRHPFVFTDAKAAASVDRFWMLAEIIRHTASLSECEEATRAAINEFCDRQQIMDADLRDFLQRCTATDPHRRATLDELLVHPFLTKHVGKFSNRSTESYLRSAIAARLGEALSMSSQLSQQSQHRAELSGMFAAMPSAASTEVPLPRASSASGPHLAPSSRPPLHSSALHAANVVSRYHQQHHPLSTSTTGGQGPAPPGHHHHHHHHDPGSAGFGRSQQTRSKSASHATPPTVGTPATRHAAAHGFSGRGGHPPKQPPLPPSRTNRPAGRVQIRSPAASDFQLESAQSSPSRLPSNHSSAQPSPIVPAAATGTDGRPLTSAITFENALRQPPPDNVATAGHAGDEDDTVATAASTAGGMMVPLSSLFEVQRMADSMADTASHLMPPAASNQLPTSISSEAAAASPCNHANIHAAVTPPPALAPVARGDDEGQGPAQPGRSPHIVFNEALNAYDDGNALAALSCEDAASSSEDSLRSPPSNDAAAAAATAAGPANVPSASDFESADRHEVSPRESSSSSSNPTTAGGSDASTAADVRVPPLADTALRRGRATEKPTGAKDNGTSAASSRAASSNAPSSSDCRSTRPSTARPHYAVQPDYGCLIRVGAARGAAASEAAECSATATGDGAAAAAVIRGPRAPNSRTSSLTSYSGDSSSTTNPVAAVLQHTATSRTAPTSPTQRSPKPPFAVAQGSGDGVPLHHRRAASGGAVAQFAASRQAGGGIVAGAHPASGRGEVRHSSFSDVTSLQGLLSLASVERVDDPCETAGPPRRCVMQYLVPRHGHTDSRVSDSSGSALVELQRCSQTAAATAATAAATAAARGGSRTDTTTTGSSDDPSRANSRSGHGDTVRFRTVTLAPQAVTSATARSSTIDAKTPSEGPSAAPPAASAEADGGVGRPPAGRPRRASAAGRPSDDRSSAADPVSVNAGSCFDHVGAPAAFLGAEFVRGAQPRAPLSLSSEPDGEANPQAG